MDGWGSLTMLIKRQQTDRWRKTELRAQLRKRKEGFLHEKKLRNDLDFPEISVLEMQKIKQQIRQDFKKERVQNTIFYIFVLLICIGSVLLIYFYVKDHP